MDIQGRIIEVCAVQSGVGKNSGREWSCQEFVIEYNENTQYPRQACLRIFGSDRIAEFNVQVGEYVQVAYDIESSKYMERWYTRLNAYRISRVQPGVVGPRPTSMPDIPPYTMMDAPNNVQQQYYQQPAQYQQPQYQQQQYQQPQYQQPAYTQPAAPQPAVNAPVAPTTPTVNESESDKYKEDLPF